MLDKLFSKLKESGIEIDEDDFYYGARECKINRVS